jgi:hypothetical protein
MNSTVYYPDLYPSLDWLKIGALCWDTVYTIRSPKATPASEEIAEFSGQLGNFIDSRHAGTLARNPDVSEKFINWLRLTQQSNSKYPKNDELLNEQEWYGMFADKFSEEIIAELQSLSLVRPAPHIYDVLVPKTIGLHYMSLCAAKLAEDEKADLFADQKAFAETAVFSKAARSVIITSIMKAYLPQNLHSLETEQIKDLRSELSMQRLQFQASVQSLCDEYAKVTSEEKLHTKQKEIADIGKARIETVRRAYKRANVTAVLTGLGISLIPGAVSSIASMLSVGIFSPAAIVSAVATTSANILVQKEKAQDDLKSNPWSYVLQVEKRTKKRR